MLSLLAVVVAGAAPTLAAPGFSCPGIEPGFCDAYLEHFASAMTSRGVKVLSKNDVAQVLSIERQRELLGCAEGGSSCLAELAGALGVGNVLTGTVAKLESGYLSTLKVIDASEGTTKWTASERVEGERALFAFLEGRARDLVDYLRPPPPPTPFVRFVPGLLGAAFSLGVIPLQVLAEREADRLRAVGQDSALGVDDVASTARGGRLLQTLAFSSLALGVAGLATSFIWLVAGAAAEPGVRVSIGTLPGGGAITVSWEAP
ncbi:MAG: hypothetical protein MUC96_31390 [Myxococcaceae bacterium]|nr:hypothetical protein [Myxococcaceae bacterium]